MGLHRVELVTHGLEETRAAGRTLGAHARAGDVILLVGALGAGKTCLTQGIVWGLGVDEYARSPTFVLVNQYDGRLVLYHMDLYRLETLAEIADLGLDEYLLGEGVCVVEWAEKGLEVLPRQHLMVRIEYLGERSRRLTFTASGRGYAGLLSAVESTVVPPNV